MSIRVTPFFNFSRNMISRVELLVTQSKMSPAGRSALAVYEDLTLSAGNSDFRLYELLKNNSRFLRITGASNESETGRLRQRSLSVSGSSKSGSAKWWRMTGSNRRPPACKAGALPAELIPRFSSIMKMVGLVGLEPTTPALSRRCSNQLSYRPFTLVCEASALLGRRLGAACLDTAPVRTAPRRLTFTCCVFNYSR
jgi:hypothetical protein